MGGIEVEPDSLPHGPICSSTLYGIDGAIHEEIWSDFIARNSLFGSAKCLADVPGAVLALEVFGAANFERHERYPQGVGGGEVGFLEADG